MAVYIIPNAGESADHYEFGCPLDGTSYRLAFRWNSRTAGWYLTISTLSREVLASSIKLVEGVPLLQKRRDYRLPPGDLIVSGAEPTRDNLGGAAQLFYLDLAELEEMGAVTRA